MGWSMCYVDCFSGTSLILGFVLLFVATSSYLYSFFIYLSNIFIPFWACWQACSTSLLFHMGSKSPILYCIIKLILNTFALLIKPMGKHQDDVCPFFFSLQFSYCFPPNFYWLFVQWHYECKFRSAISLCPYFIGWNREYQKIRKFIFLNVTTLHYYISGPFDLKLRSKSFHIHFTY